MDYTLPGERAERRVTLDELVSTGLIAAKAYVRGIALPNTGRLVRLDLPITAAPPRVTVTMSI
jgi:hypothetical protein